MTRVPLIVALVATTALGLTACQQPAPGATVFAGTTSQHQQAACWAFDSDQIDADTCAEDVVGGAAAGDRVPTIPVIPGQTVGISVDPVVADTGWSPRIGGQTLTQTPITSTYFRFTFPEFQDVPPEGLVMEVVAGGSDSTRGIWLFRLTPA